MRRSLTVPDALDLRLTSYAKHKDMVPGDVIIDALANYLGYRLTTAEIRARKPRYTDPIVARHAARASSITRTAQQRAILKAMENPEQDRIIRQIMDALT